MFNLSRTPAQPTKGKYDRVHVLRNSPQDHLADLIANPPENSVKTQITPKLAADMLAYNRSNRPVQSARVTLYARQMAAGEWRYTREPIIFSDAGRVIDGQHRLMAVIEAMTPITADVAFGAADDCFAFIDVGATRTASDIFAINGVKSWKAISAMTRMVYQYDQGRQTISGGGKITAAELYEEYLKLDGLENSLPIVSKFGASRLASPAMMGAMHHLCARKHRKEADEFFAIANDGGSGKSPAVELHRRLMRNAISNEKLGKDLLAGLILTAWNRHRKGLAGRGLRFDGGKLPAVL